MFVLALTFAVEYEIFMCSLCARFTHKNVHIKFCHVSTLFSTTYNFCYIFKILRCSIYLKKKNLCVHFCQHQNIHKNIGVYYNIFLNFCNDYISLILLFFYNKILFHENKFLLDEQKN